MKVLFLFIIMKPQILFTFVKLKCETDFVAKNDDFLSFANQLTKAIHENK